MKALILCYHKVGSQADQGRRLNVNPERLATHVRFFQRRRYKFLRAKDLSSPWPSKAVCFTFDDAYTSAVTFGAPIFLSRSLPATFYAVANLVGEKSDWDGPLARSLAGWDELRALERDGFEVGNHTSSHAKLAALTPEEQLQEIVDAHARLESEGLHPESFCYPYGNLNDSAIQAVRKAGYQVGLALGKRVATSSDPLLALPRVVVAFSDALPKLLYKIHIRPRLPK